jgi:hypothetical protein
MGKAYLETSAMSTEISRLSFKLQKWTLFNGFKLEKWTPGF